MQLHVYGPSTDQKLFSSLLSKKDPVNVKKVKEILIVNVLWWEFFDLLSIDKDNGKEMHVFIWTTRLSFNLCYLFLHTYTIKCYPYKINSLLSTYLHINMPSILFQFTIKDSEMNVTPYLKAARDINLSKPFLFVVVVVVTETMKENMLL